MSKCLRVADLDHEPVIGRLYLVPCVVVPFGHGEVAPVIGRWHEDAEHIGFPQWHYHRDLRFCPWPLHTARDVSSAAGMVVSHGSDSNGAPIMSDEELPVVYRRRKCLRAMPEYPRGGQKIGGLSPCDSLPILPRLWEAYRGATMRNMRCPHKGFDLRSCPVKDGVVECPLHGLRWEIATGRLAP